MEQQRRGINNCPIQVGDYVYCPETRVKGIVKRFYIPTSCEEQTLIATEDGREYHAPTRMWEPYQFGKDPGQVVYGENGLYNHSGITWQFFKIIKENDQ